MDLQMNGKTALVTGGSAGIGKAIAFALAREGVDVAICARRKGPLEAAASQIPRETNRKIVPIPADLTKPADAEAFVKEAHNPALICPRPIPICSTAREHAGVFRLSTAGVAACTNTTV